MNIIDCSKAMKPWCEAFVELGISEYSGPEACVPIPSIHNPEQAIPPPVSQCLLHEVRTHRSGWKPLGKGH